MLRCSTTSFEDDPARRSGRPYAAPWTSTSKPKTAELMMKVNLGSISRDRVESELRLIALEDNALEALRLARLWGLVDFPEERLDLIEQAIELIEIEPWRDEARGEALILEVVFGNLSRAEGPSWGARNSLAGLPAHPGRTALELVVAARWAPSGWTVGSANGAGWSSGSPGPTCWPPGFPKDRKSAPAWTPPWKRSWIAGRAG